MKNERTYWNNDAANYDKRAQKSQKAYQNILATIKNDVSAEMDLLDMGTGTGDVPLGLCTDVKSISAIDFSHEMIRRADKKAERNGVENITFLVQDSNHLVYDDNSFDVVLIINLLHVVPDPISVIKEAKRVVKKDGKIIIASFLHRENLRSRLISYIMKSKGHPIVSQFNSKTICDFISKCSLKIESKKKIKNIMPLMYTTCSAK